MICMSLISSLDQKNDFEPALPQQCSAVVLAWMRLQEPHNRSGVYPVLGNQSMPGLLLGAAAVRSWVTYAACQVRQCRSG